MKKYLSFFRIRFSAGLQYRAAALAGIATQFAFGGMFILIYAAFYRSNASSFPMTFPQLASYLWLQQAFLALFMVWFMENDLFLSISSGNVAYELCRPLDLYHMWFVRSIAYRLARALLRCFPILIFAFFLPEPYNLKLPHDLQCGAFFVLSMLLGFLLVVAFCLLVYITAFYTISPMGVRLVASSMLEILTGAIIPLPFLPDNILKVVNLLPFASISNTPFLIYGGYLTGADALHAVALQLIWLALFWAGGLLWMKAALKRVVVQGG